MARAVAAAAVPTRRQRVNPSVSEAAVPRRGARVATPMAPPTWRAVLNAADAAPWSRGWTALIASEVSVATRSPELNPAGIRARTNGQSGATLLAHARTASDAVRPPSAAARIVRRSNRRASGAEQRVATEITP